MEVSDRKLDVRSMPPMVRLDESPGANRGNERKENIIEFDRKSI